MIVRLAEKKELDRINELRRQVSDLHVAGKPEVFKPGFPEELRDFIHVIHNDPAQKIVMAEEDGEVVGYAVLHHIHRPETPFMFERDYLDIDEFGVDSDHRRQGIASEMMAFIRDLAREMGFSRIELNMWEFNRDALAFYEAAGFTTYRRYMEMKIMKNGENIAYCGLDCETCEAHIATVNNDEALRDKVAKKWSELNGVEITPEMINCDGCRVEGVKTPFCESLCPIRQCALTRAVASCGDCKDMQTCEKLKMITDSSLEAKERLETR